VLSRAATLSAVASKKRKSGKPAKRRQGKGLSGNPQHRVQQLRERDAADLLRQQSRWAGSFGPGRRTWPWWAESHERVLARVRATEWPTRLLDIEALSGRLAGDEFYERLSAPGPGTGLTPAGWLRALAEAAIKAMRADFAGHRKEWPKLWAFCCGLADEESLDDLDAGADVIAGHGPTPVPGIPVPWYQPTAGADVLVARDAYGARFLLIAPFSDPGQPADPDHWYAWDLDWCVDGLVVAAGAYGSTTQALAEWRISAGPSAATAELASCPPELGIRLLDPALAGSPQAESVLGDEPAEFLREIPRLSRRAGALTASLSPLLPKKPSSLLSDFRDSAIEDFLGWHTEHAGQPADVRDQAEGALELLLAEWGPDVPPDEQAFYACSPHRIQACASILRDSYEPDWVNKALPLLPDWTRWCASKTALDAEAAERALAAARAEAAILASETHTITEDEAPFRRAE
jgi:hypothetical protein